MSTSDPNSKGTAYFLWALGIFGICGLQRLYLGRMKSGILYLLTVGLCGIGQLFDALLIPSMADDANRDKRIQTLESAYTQPPVSHSDHAPKASGSSSSSARTRQFEDSPASTAASNTPRNAHLRGDALDLAIINVLHRQNHQSFSQLWVALECDKQELKKRLESLQREDLIRISNRDSDGAVVYSYL